MPRTLIIVDDDVFAALELSHALSEFGFAVLGQARNPDMMRKLLRVRLPAAALVNAELSRGDSGVALARDLQACGVRVVLTGRGPVEGWTGPFLAKPFATRTLVDLLTARPEHRPGADSSRPHP